MFVYRNSELAKENDGGVAGSNSTLHAASTKTSND